MKRLLLASNNRGKIAEFKALFAPLSIEILTLKEVGIESEPEESGLTFVENALIKARHGAALSGLPTLADDSGLVVPALNGAPGIYSARYSEEGSDQANNLALLKAMEGLPAADRKAAFVALLVLLRHEEDPIPYIASGEVSGEILEAPRGTEGFGYDPLFYLPSEKMTFAEIPPARKNLLSHRANAAQTLLTMLNPHHKGRTL